MLFKVRQDHGNKPASWVLVVVAQNQPRGIGRPVGVKVGLGVAEAATAAVGVAAWAASLP